MPRRWPNIVMTGAPGVGKTTTITSLLSLASSSYPLKHTSINDIVKSKDCHEGYDDEMKSYIVDEDKLLDELEKELDVDGEDEGGFILDWHACDLFPERWIDLVVVLRCEDTRVFHDRLRARDYSDVKLQENLDAEIFGMLAEEAREAFDENIVVELKSETADDIDSNVERLLGWIDSWRKDKAANG